MVERLKTLLKSILGVALCSLLVTGTSLWADDAAQDALDRMKRSYDLIVDAQIKFSQRTRFELTRLEQSVNGTLLLKKTNKYRLETDGQTVVTNGETVWSYAANNKQVLVDHFKKDENAVSPENILTGAPSQYVATSLGKEKLGKSDVVILKLTAKSEQSVVTSMKLWVDNSTWLIRKASLADVSGKHIEYLVTDLRTNIGIQDSQFVFQVPEGVEVVDLR